MKKIIFILFVLFMFKLNTYALTYGGCEYSDVARMKQLANNINVSYDYRIVNNIAYFDVTLTNLSNDIYVFDNVKKQKLYGKNGELVIYGYATSGVTFKFYSNKPQCRDIMLGSKYAQFPIYNKFYNADVCKNMSGFTYCNKWTNKAYTEAEIKKAIDDYYASLEQEEKPIEFIEAKTFLDRLLEFYVKYYVIILAGIAILCLALIEVIKRRNRFNL